MIKNETILVTGGTGYIGSHTCLELLNHNCKVIVIDNLTNSSVTSLKRVAKLSEKTFSLKPSNNADLCFYNSSICNSKILRDIFNRHHIDAVIHFAGLKAVKESVIRPLDYYMNNVMGSINLFKEMDYAKVKRLVFSSSATVYGSPKKMPITERFNVGNTVNPYGQSKYFIENILKDIVSAGAGWKISILRYFNPIGADSSGSIGEDPSGIPNNLMPFISQVAIGKLEKLKIFGNTYPTHDGTGIRDYIHVSDLAMGHLEALKFINSNSDTGISIFNLGTGKGTSVLELVNAFEKVNKIKIPYEIVSKRDGDIAECWASTDYAESVLGWKARFDIYKMCEDAWRWQRQNPNGYQNGS